MSLGIAVLTVSDTRTLDDDKSGNLLVERIALPHVNTHHHEAAAWVVDSVPLALSRDASECGCQLGSRANSKGGRRRMEHTPAASRTFTAGEHCSRSTRWASQRTIAWGSRRP